MKKIFLYVLLVVGVMSSCMKHDNLYTGEGDDDSDKKKEEYDKNFPVKDIDPEQDWNMAKQVIVNVTVNYGGSGEYTIKIYSENPRDPEVQAYLLGKYTVKDGSTNALAVDAVSGAESVYVCCVDVTDGTVMKWGAIENGKVNVSFGVMPKNRAASGRADDGWKDIDLQSIKALVDKDNGAFKEGETPSGGAILTSYEFIYKGPFKIYLVFGETDGQDEVGYYYYKDDGTMGHETLITNLQADNPPFMQIYVWDQWWSWLSNPNEGGGTAALDLAKGMQSRPCVIDLDNKNLSSNRRVGFYVRPNGNPNTIYYSNETLNSGRIHSAVLSREDGSATPEYIGLEDNPNEEGRDCNDIIFYIPGSPDNETPPEVVDPNKPNKPETPATWIVACEDLGSTGDYDFNDIVFGVSHVAGQEKAEVIPYAAGGTLPANIYWNGTDLGEIHKLLGNNTTTTMINTNNKGNPGEPCEIKVEKNFSMSSTNMGGFSLKIGDKKADITPPGKGKVPQMICVPGGWAWPKERTNIAEAYSGFGEWGANYGTGTDWWQNSTSGKVVQ